MATSIRQDDLVEWLGKQLELTPLFLGGRHSGLTEGDFVLDSATFVVRLLPTDCGLAIDAEVARKCRLIAKVGESYQAD